MNNDLPTKQSLWKSRWMMLLDILFWVGVTSTLIHFEMIVAASLIGALGIVFVINMVQQHITQVKIYKQIEQTEQYYNEMKDFIEQLIKDYMDGKITKDDVNIEDQHTKDVVLNLFDVLDKVKEDNNESNK